jgi:hypothetical protein
VIQQLTELDASMLDMAPAQTLNQSSGCTPRTQSTAAKSPRTDPT